MGRRLSKAWAERLCAHRRLHHGCDEAVNPRFLLAMARVAPAKESSEPRNRRKQGVEDFRLVADGVNVLARMQLDESELARLGQQVNERLQNGSTVKAGERPDFVFYTGCNVLKTPRHGADRAGYHERAWRDLSCHGRADALLWRHSIAHGRHRGLRACGGELARQAG